MIWALKERERIKAAPKKEAICPTCLKEVIAKCGRIKVWHWAHKSKLDCDSFSEPETEWHINWKNNFPYLLFYPKRERYFVIQLLIY